MTNLPVKVCHLGSQWPRPEPPRIDVSQPQALSQAMQRGDESKGPCFFCMFLQDSPTIKNPRMMMMMMMMMMLMLVMMMIIMCSVMCNTYYYIDICLCSGTFEGSWYEGSFPTQIHLSLGNPEVDLRNKTTPSALRWHVLRRRRRNQRLLTQGPPVMGQHPWISLCRGSLLKIQSSWWWLLLGGE